MGISVAAGTAVENFEFGETSDQGSTAKQPMPTRAEVLTGDADYEWATAPPPGSGMGKGAPEADPSSGI